MIQTKRVYDSPSTDDGTRFLVERLWPRGIKKEALSMEAWCKEAGPSTELRKWFSHDPEKWTEFQRRYRAELDERPEAWQPLLDAARKGTITLLYSSHDTEHNNAVALQTYLQKHLPAPSRHHKPARPSSKATTKTTAKAPAKSKTS